MGKNGISIPGILGKKGGPNISIPFFGFVLVYNCLRENLFASKIYFFLLRFYKFASNGAFLQSHGCDKLLAHKKSGKTIVIFIYKPCSLELHFPEINVLNVSKRPFSHKSKSYT